MLADQPHFAYGHCGPCALALILHTGCFVSGDAHEVKDIPEGQKIANAVEAGLLPKRTEKVEHVEVFVAAE